MEKNVKIVGEDTEQNDVLDVLEQAADNLDESELEVDHRWHERTTESTTVRALIKRQKEGRIQLPLCQRLYVWDAKKRAELLESIKSNFSCGTIIVAENDGVQYLVDGLQRLTSCMYLSIDHDKAGLTSEEKKTVLNYSITLSIVKDMSDDDIRVYFNRLNSGVALAAAVKERSKLPKELNDAILTISSHRFFRTLNEDGNIQTSATFSKSHHHEVISMNALLAAANAEMGENKAKSLCKSIEAYSVAVLEHVKDAEQLINRLEEIYKRLDSDIAKRSLNANFISVLLYALVSKEITDEQIIDLTSYIYAGRRPKEEYAATTRSNAADAKNVLKRYELICKWIDNPPMQEFDEQDFRMWLKKYNGKSIKNHDGSLTVDFSDIGEDERRGIYIAARDGKWCAYDAIISKFQQGNESEK